MSSITIEGLTKRYGRNTVVDELYLSIGEGEFVTLLGPSGCGKTTTLRAIAGLEMPDSGRIDIGATTVTATESGTMVPPHRRNLGMVFQSYAIWPHLSVFDNVAYPLRRKRLASAVVLARVTEVLHLVGLAHTARRSATELSGGQQQRVALARAIVAEPNVLLFDEPLSNLDAQLRISLREEIHRVRSSQNTTSVYVTHDQSEAFALSDRVAIMLNGRIVQLDRPDRVVSHPASLDVARFLGFENIARATVVDSVSDTVVLDVPHLGIRLQADRGNAAHRAGDSVTAVFRAASVTIAGNDDLDRSNTLSGRVVRSTFLGEDIQYRIRVGDSDVLARVGFDGTPPLAPTTDVSLHISPAALLTFTDIGTISDDEVASSTPIVESEHPLQKKALIR
ncbi:ABC transporter ATP-binding protein [Rhodococcoides yunnanense]|uniref:ABC transporter ATP-binding protein n=1 Tax=Rhodococcoides yunnanense TaxID=278209 RepID=UPI00093248F8|nr:ABC transporter ATP-binding protein [Rhodococcus yunnanensis]